MGTTFTSAVARCCGYTTPEEYQAVRDATVELVAESRVELETLEKQITASEKRWRSHMQTQQTKAAEREYRVLLGLEAMHKKVQSHHLAHQTAESAVRGVVTLEQKKQKLNRVDNFLSRAAGPAGSKVDRNVTEIENSIGNISELNRAIGGLNLASVLPSADEAMDGEPLISDGGKETEEASAFTHAMNERFAGTSKTYTTSGAAETMIQNAPSLPNRTRTIVDASDDRSGANPATVGMDAAVTEPASASSHEAGHPQTVVAPSVVALPI